MKLVLLVDDSKSARLIISKLLQKFGLEVLTAESGEDGLAVLQSRIPDVIFLDYMMPGLNGIETMQRVHANPATAHVPVVLCTGDEGGGFLAEAREKGAADILIKPPSAEAIQAVLSRLAQAAAAKPAPAPVPEPVAVAAPAAPPAAAPAAQPPAGESLETTVRELLRTLLPQALPALLEPHLKALSQSMAGNLGQTLTARLEGHLTKQRNDLLASVDQRLAAQPRTEAPDLEPRFQAMEEAFDQKLAALGGDLAQLVEAASAQTSSAPVEMPAVPSAEEIESLVATALESRLHATEEAFDQKLAALGGDLAQLVEAASAQAPSAPMEMPAVPSAEEIEALVAAALDARLAGVTGELDNRLESLRLKLKAEMGSAVEAVAHSIPQMPDMEPRLHAMEEAFDQKLAALGGDLAQLVEAASAQTPSAPMAMPAVPSAEEIEALVAAALDARLAGVTGELDNRLESLRLKLKAEMGSAVEAVAHSIPQTPDLEPRLQEIEAAFDQKLAALEGDLAERAAGASVPPPVVAALDGRITQVAAEFDGKLAQLGDDLLQLVTSQPQPEMAQGGAGGVAAEELEARLTALSELFDQKLAMYGDDLVRMVTSSSQQPEALDSTIQVLMGPPLAALGEEFDRKLAGLGTDLMQLVESSQAQTTVSAPASDMLEPRLAALAEEFDQKLASLGTDLMQYVESSTGQAGATPSSADVETAVAAALEPRLAALSGEFEEKLASLGTDLMQYVESSTGQAGAAPSSADVETAVAAALEPRLAALSGEFEEKLASLGTDLMQYVESSSGQTGATPSSADVETAVAAALEPRLAALAGEFEEKLASLGTDLMQYVESSTGQAGAAPAPDDIETAVGAAMEQRMAALSGEFEEKLASLGTDLMQYAESIARPAGAAPSAAEGENTIAAVLEPRMALLTEEFDQKLATLGTELMQYMEANASAPAGGEPSPSPEALELALASLLEPRMQAITAEFDDKLTALGGDLAQLVEGVAANSAGGGVAVAAASSEEIHALVMRELESQAAQLNAELDLKLEGMSADLIRMMESGGTPPPMPDIGPRLEQFRNELYSSLEGQIAARLGDAEDVESAVLGALEPRLRDLRGDLDAKLEAMNEDIARLVESSVEQQAEESPALESSQVESLVAQAVETQLGSMGSDLERRLEQVRQDLLAELGERPQGGLNEDQVVQLVADQIALVLEQRLEGVIQRVERELVPRIESTARAESDKALAQVQKKLLTLVVEKLKEPISQIAVKMEKSIGGLRHQMEKQRKELEESARVAATQIASEIAEETAERILMHDSDMETTRFVEVEKGLNQRVVIASVAAALIGVVFAIALKVFW